MATKLLYTVRNNLFHSQKDRQRGDDAEVVKTAYELLEPLIMPLKQRACEKLKELKDE